MNLKQLQDEQWVWTLKNFGAHSWRDPFMGVVEEVGELSHALLKQAQGIRGTHAEHEEAAKDAVGDIIIYLADLCSTRGWDFAEVVDATWTTVKQRDWTKNKTDGRQP